MKIQMDIERAVRHIAANNYDVKKTDQEILGIINSVNTAISANAYNFDDLSTIVLNQNGKKRVVKKYEDIFSVENVLCQHIKHVLDREFKVKYPNRNKVIRSLFSYIAAAKQMTNFTVVKFDFKDYYNSLNCKVDTLLLSRTTNDNLIRSKIFSSDIIYIGGGNTAKMMRIFKRTKVNEYLKTAYEKGIVLTGLSAGAMVYFTNGYSDSNRSTNPNASLCEVKCLNLIPYCFCPHYNEEERKSFDEFIKNKNYKGLALEDNCALIFIDDKIEGVIKSNDDANGYYININSKELIK